MQPNTVFAHIVLSDGTRFALETCIKGIVMEINQRLLDNPALLLQPGNDQSFLVIVKPKAWMHFCVLRVRRSHAFG